MKIKVGQKSNDTIRRVEIIEKLNKAYPSLNYTELFMKVMASNDFEEQTKILPCEPEEKWLNRLYKTYAPASRKLTIVKSIIL